MRKRTRQNQPVGRTKGNRQQRENNGSSASVDVPVVKNGSYVMKITGLTHEGNGVGHVEQFALFIPGALPGETVRVHVVKVLKKFGFAKLMEVIEPSEDRVVPPCAVYGTCGGCQLQHLSYEAQLQWKRQAVIDALERIGKLNVSRDSDAAGRAEEHSVSDRDGMPWQQGVEVGIAGDESGHEPIHVNELKGAAPRAGTRSETAVLVHPVLGMADPWAYRNKGQIPIGTDREGGLITGFYAQNSHRIIDVDTCYIQQETNDTVMRKVKEIGRKLGISIYDEAAHKGLLRHVIIKTGYHTGEIMIVLVTNGTQIPRLQDWIAEIRAEVPQVKSICQNINTLQTNVIYGDVTKVLWGEAVIYDTIGDIRFAISARSFYQVNPLQTKVLYDKALEYAQLSGEETVIDAYCGIGTISLFLAQQAKRVLGVEIIEDAIEDAKRNAELNGFTNAEFTAGKAEEVIPAWREQGIVPDVIVVDPPRKGCDPALLDTIIAMQPDRVVYVSCNPSTLARDLRILEDGGFRTVEVQPVDMFPQTTHCEVVSYLTRE